MSELAIIRGAPLEEEPGLGALTLPDFLAEVTARFGGREALVLHEAGRRISWTYDALDQRARDVAAALIAGGSGKGERIGILMSNRPEWVSACFGIAMAGGVAVGLSTFSTGDELAHLIAASGISTLLAERHVAGKDFAAMLDAMEPDAFPYLGRVVMLGESGFESWERFIASGSAVDAAMVDARAAAVTPADPALIFFSSGSTGKPKGVVNGHRGVNVQSWRWARIYTTSPDDHVRTWAPNGLFWSGNFSLALGGTFAVGGALILQRTFDPAEAVKLMEAERVTLPYCWPHQWAQLEAAPGWADADLSSFRFFEPGQNLRQPQKSIATHWVEPHASYGSTETFTISTSFPCDAPEAVWKGNNGEALPGNTLRIVDPASGETLQRGETGEIAVKGPTLMLGYLGVPPEEAFDDSGYYRTGDGGLIDETGRLVFQGRINDIIKTGGANVSPVVLQTFTPGQLHSAQSTSTGVPHETLGEMVVSCVVRVAGSTLDEAEVIAFLKGKLAAYKVPRRVLFIAEDDLDFTDTAKIKPAEAKAFAVRKLEAEQC